MQQHVLLAPYTTFKIGGEADFFCLAKTVEDVHDAVVFAHEHDLNIVVLGGGSNVLVSDNGIKGMVIKIDIQDFDFEEYGEAGFGQWYVGAGYDWDAFVADTVDRGYGGVEPLSYIPGTVGGAVVQNIGAYGSELQNIDIEVRAINTATLEEKIFSKDEMEFGYRNSFFKTRLGQRWIVLGCVIKLQKTQVGLVNYKEVADYIAKRHELYVSTLPEHTILPTPVPTPLDVREAVITIRKEKLPNWHTVGTAGSYFKNPVISREQYLELQLLYPELPCYGVIDSTTGEQDDTKVKIPLGYVLDKLCKLKGYRQKLVGLYEKQALVIVAEHGAKAYMIRELADYVRANVREKINTEIEAEVVYLC